MKGWRTILSMLLCLTLVGQSVAAASIAPTMSAGTEKIEVSATGAMPCHGVMPIAEQPGTHKPPCCDTFCPDMTSCALSQLATL
ncbi:unnamed protein product, partial [Phaeothamnion confervicola]